jgi:hypothetical protein
MKMVAKTDQQQDTIFIDADGSFRQNGADI